MSPGDTWTQVGLLFQQSSLSGRPLVSPDRHPCLSAVPKGTLILVTWSEGSWELTLLRDWCRQALQPNLGSIATLRFSPWVGSPLELQVPVLGPFIPIRQYSPSVFGVMPREQLTRAGSQASHHVPIREALTHWEDIPSKVPLPLFPEDPHLRHPLAASVELVI